MTFAVRGLIMIMIGLDRTRAVCVHQVWKECSRTFTGQRGFWRETLPRSMAAHEITSSAVLLNSHAARGVLQGNSRCPSGTLTLTLRVRIDP